MLRKVLIDYSMFLRVLLILLKVSSRQNLIFFNVYRTAISYGSSKAKKNLTISGLEFTIFLMYIFCNIS
jgi:hypothetical protein